MARQPSEAGPWDWLPDALAQSGLVILGAFTPEPGDDAPALSSGAQPGAALMVGNAGSALWQHFAGADGPGSEAHPLDRWTARTIDPIAARLGAVAVYPFERPHRPFLRWAGRTGVLHHSPIGLSIHADYGLWHAYRAALFLAAAVPDHLKAFAQSPCESCADRPCLTACPVNAFSDAGFDVATCRDHVRKGAEPACGAIGCAARHACPVGRGFRYDAVHAAFHMAAFAPPS